MNTQDCEDHDDALYCAAHFFACTTAGAPTHASDRPHASRKTSAGPCALQVSKRTSSQPPACKKDKHASDRPPANKKDKLATLASQPLAHCSSSLATLGSQPVARSPSVKSSPRTAIARVHSEDTHQSVVKLNRPCNASFETPSPDDVHHSEKKSSLHTSTRSSALEIAVFDLQRLQSVLQRWTAVL